MGRLEDASSCQLVRKKEERVTCGNDLSV